MDDDGFGATGGMNMQQGNRSTRKPAQMPLCPSQITYDLILDGTRAARWEAGD
jgi:hypothetical protein